MQTQSPPPRITDTQLIKLAYSMVAGPQRYLELLIALQNRVVALEQASEIAGEGPDARDARMRQDLEPVAPHFANADALMDEMIVARRPIDFAVRAIDRDDRPSLLLTVQNRIIHANEAATGRLELKVGGQIDDRQLVPAQRRALSRYLSRLPDVALGQTVGIVSAADCETGEPIRLCLTRAENAAGEPIAHLTALQIGWSSAVGSAMADAFDLSAAELSVTQAIIAGQPLADLADARGTKLGTVRNQLKALLRKLELRSQNELLSFYAGFAALDYAPTGSAEAAEAQQEFFSPRSVHLSDNRTLHYDVAGPADGLPIIWFPPLMGWTALAAEAQASLLHAGIRLIRAERPGLGRSDPMPSGVPYNFESYAGDIAALVEAEELDRPVILGTLSGGPFAIGCATYLAGSIAGVITCNPTLPMARGPHISKVTLQERVRRHLIRTAPELAIFEIKSTLRSIASGYDFEYVRPVVSRNPYDLDLMDDAVMYDDYRRAMHSMLAVNLDGPATNFIAAAADWSALLDTAKAPIVNLVASHAFNYNPEVSSLFAQEQPAFTFEVVPDAGQLLHQRHMSLIIAKARALRRMDK